MGIVATSIMQMVGATAYYSTSSHNQLRYQGITQMFTLFSLSRAAFTWLAIILSSTSLFLSSWIVVPAFNLSVLPLGVGAPEVSPWLLLLNALTIFLLFT